MILNEIYLMNLTLLVTKPNHFKIMMTKFILRFQKTCIQSLLLFALVLPVVLMGQNHELWDDYRTNTSPRLINWSSSGYDSGNSSIPYASVTHNVTSYGAIANDGIDDRAAVQSAIDAAATAGGGVVYFPAGQFDFWVGANGHTLEITTSDVVLRGAGQTNTTLMQHNFYQGTSSTKRYYLINVETPHSLLGNDKLFAQNAYRHDRTIKLTATTGILEGDVILLQMVRPNGTDALSKDLISPLQPETYWTNFNRYFPIEQMVTVQKVDADGQTLTLEQPLHEDYLTGYTAKAKLVDSKLLKNIGVEDLKLKGSWTNTYIHHNSFEDDYGWNAIGFTGIVNSWIRDIETENLGTDIDLKDSGFCTIQNIESSGYAGHSGIAVSHSYSNLITDYTIQVFKTHSIGMSNISSGNVFTDITNNSGLPGAIDFHGGGPSNNNLIEDSSNLRISSGGAEYNMPHAGQNNVFWNVSAGPKTNYEDMFTYGLYNYSNYSGTFQLSDLHQLYPKSVLVGITDGNGGTAIKIDGTTSKTDNSWYYIDAIGQNVTPTSLYNEQKTLAVAPVEAGQVTALASVNNRFMSSKNGQSPMYCDRITSDTWGTFTLSYDSSNNASFKGNNGKYVSFANTSSMMCDATTIGTNEKFELIPLGNNYFAIKGNNGKFVSSRNGQSAMTCYSNSIGSWEKFVIIPKTYSNKVGGGKIEETLGPEESALEGFYVFPNPLKRGTEIFINTKEPITQESKIKVVLFDSYGKKIQSFEKKDLNFISSQTMALKGSNTIDSGMYILKVSIDNNSFVNKILIK